MLGIIRELFIVEEKLLAGCKNKVGAAIYALQYPIYKLHGRLPEREETHRNPACMPIDLRFPFPFASTCLYIKGQGRGKDQRLC
jgi:hypothetical protein